MGFLLTDRTLFIAAVAPVASLQRRYAARVASPPISPSPNRATVWALCINAVTEQLIGNNMSQIIDNTAQNRFELPVEGYLATEHYNREGNVITLQHTEVPPELGGKGVGSTLVKAVLDRVRGQGLKVVAQCTFVKSWIDRHPDYADLLRG
jgi:predicted GNAT family acetyltransferase